MNIGVYVGIWGCDRALLTLRDRQKAAMPRGQKQQSMEKTLRPRWSLGGIRRKLSSLSESLEYSLCRKHTKHWMNQMTERLFIELSPFHISACFQGKGRPNKWSNNDNKLVGGLRQSFLHGVKINIVTHYECGGFLEG